LPATLACQGVSTFVAGFGVCTRPFDRPGPQQRAQQGCYRQSASCQENSHRALAIGTAVANKLPDRVRRKSGLVAGGREQIAAAPDGADHCGLGRVDLDLAPDPHDPEIDGAIEGFGVARIGQLQQPLARQHTFRIGRENLEQAEFGRGQRMLIALVVAQRLRLEIEPLRSEPHQLVAAASAVATGARSGALRRSTERIRAINSRNSQGFAT